MSSLNALSAGGPRVAISLLTESQARRVRIGAAVLLGGAGGAVDNKAD